MRDDPIAGFALGCLAAGQGASQRIALAVAVCNRTRTSVNTDELNALLAENQYLHSLNASLCRDNAKLKAYAKELGDWGDKMAALARERGA